MWTSIACLRVLERWTLAIWVGGFTFYSAFVIPVLHDQLGSPTETGLITQRVTNSLNLLGLVTIGLAWLRLVLESTQQRARRRNNRAMEAALVLTTICLLLLFQLHRVMDHQLELSTLTGFYPIHRIYLWISTVQWLANLALLIPSTSPERPVNSSDPSEKSQVL